VAEKEKQIFSDEYLLKRPLLSAITETAKPPVLLIDELDRSDEEFEAFLLELLSAFQITIPELGTIKAVHKPYVILTSNRTRELSDALKRRCLYHWIDYPDVAKEMKIVKKRLPGIEQHLLEQVVGYVHQFRQKKLVKVPGVSETIDWAESLMALGLRDVNKEAIDKTLGSILKSTEDIALVKADLIAF
jgi:MoxR-like ATPase